MKKFLGVFLVVCMCVFVFAGCSDDRTSVGFTEKEFLDFAIKYRLDYLPEFNQETLSYDAEEYLMYAFVIDVERIKSRADIEEANCWMEVSHVEDVARTYFGAEPLNHGDMFKTWDYDETAQRYTAIPGGYNFASPYAMLSCETEETNDGTIYTVTASPILISELVGALIPLDAEIESESEINPYDEDMAEFMALIEREGIFKEGMTYYEALCEIFDKGLSSELNHTMVKNTFVFTMIDGEPRFLSHEYSFGD